MELYTDSNVLPKWTVPFFSHTEGWTNLIQYSINQPILHFLDSPKKTRLKFPGLSKFGKDPNSHIIFQWYQSKILF